MAARRRVPSPVRAGTLPHPRRRGAPSSRTAATRSVPSARLLPTGASIAVGLGLLVLAITAYVGARESSLFAVHSVTVRGAQPGVAHQVEQALSPLVGESLLKIDEGTVTGRLSSVPWVSSVTFDRAYPNTLVVTIKPERPVAVLRTGAEGWLLSSRGRVLEQVPRRTHPSLPRIWAGAAAHPEVGAVLGDTPGGRAARALAPLHWIHFPARVASVSTTDSQLTLVLRSGLELRLGDATDLRLKLAVARQVLQRLAVVGDGTYVDVSVPERPVASANTQVGG